MMLYEFTVYTVDRGEMSNVFIIIKPYAIFRIYHFLYYTFLYIFFLRGREKIVRMITGPLTYKLRIPIGKKLIPIQIGSI